VLFRSPCCYTCSSCFGSSTHCDGRGKFVAHPVYLTLANIPLRYRSSAAAKRVVAYLPILKATSKTEENSLPFRRAKLTILHNAMNDLLLPLRSNNQYRRGRLYRVRGEVMRLIAMIGFIVADWQEAAALSLIRGSWKAHCACHACLLRTAAFSDMDQPCNRRTTIDTARIVMQAKEGDVEAQDQAQQLSMHLMENAFWHHYTEGGFCVYQGLPPCRMHTGSGLFVHMLDLTAELYKEKFGVMRSGKLLREVNNRCRQINRFRGQKVFVSGLYGVGGVAITATERRQQMVLAPFLFKDLSGDEEVDGAVVRCFLLFLQHYKLACSTRLSEDDLKQLEDLGLQWGRLFVETFSQVINIVFIINATI